MGWLLVVGTLVVVLEVCDGGRRRVEHMCPLGLPK